MCIEVTRCAAKLSSHGALFQESQLTFQAVSKHLNFLTQASGRSRLSVRFSQHRDILPLLSVSIQLIDEFLKQRQVSLLHGLLQHQGERGIVNILRSQAKVNELFIFVESAHLVELFFNKVLNGLYIVVCHAFNSLDTSAIFF